MQYVDIISIITRIDIGYSMYLCTIRQSYNTYSSCNSVAYSIVPDHSDIRDLNMIYKKRCLAKSNIMCIGSSCSSAHKIHDIVP